MKPIRPIHDEKIRNYEKVHERTFDILNGNVSLGGMQTDLSTEFKGNLDNKHVNVTSPAAPDTEFAVTHNLGRVPTAAYPVRQSNSGVVYQSATSWTTTQVFLKCSSANNTIILCIY